MAETTTPPEAPREPDGLAPAEAALLALALAPVAPDPARSARLRARVLAATSPAPGAEPGWRDFLPGIRLRTLAKDPATRSETTLWELAPGAKVPPHPHRGEEVCQVLRGEIVHEGRTWVAGETLRAQPGEKHSVFVAEHGALLLIRSEPVPRGWLLRTVLRMLTPR